MLSALVLAVLLAACAGTPIDDADRLAREGRYESALGVLDESLARTTDPAQRQGQQQQRDRVVVLALAQAELALAAGRLETAEAILMRLRRLAGGHPRLPMVESRLAEARASRQAANAEHHRRIQSLAEPPASAPSPWPAAMGAAFAKPVSLELREAPLRQVFESLARASGLNFVFDRDVRADAKVTVFLREVTLDEALRVVLATQALDRKLLNGHTLLIYPNTAPKQREHQELVTRALYLVNLDPKQALALVRTMTKTRDLHADERLGALVVRDTPEVVQQIERLLATLDLPEPEVMLDVEVMEVASSRVEELGLSWPTSVRYGITGASGQVELGSRGDFRASIANPALVATLRGDAGDTNLLANPTIRARHREKAKVQIGEKLPVFTTTSTANVGVSTSVSYLEVGLKLDIEPSIQLDGEVIMKLSLEVSNLVREVSGPQGAIAYQVGTRQTSTSLRLKDGETQVLAGLINDEDRRRATGVPGLSRLPLLGRLFGVHGDTRTKNEIVMLITPHIVRRVQAPTPAQATLPSGTDSMPGAQTLRLRESARAALAAPRTGASAEPGGAARRPTATAGPGLLLITTERAAVGDTVSVGLANRGEAVLDGQFAFEAEAMEPLTPDASAAPGLQPFSLGPGQERVWLFRLLPPAAGRTLQVGLQGLREAGQVSGDGRIQVEPAAQEPGPARAPPAPDPR